MQINSAISSGLAGIHNAQSGIMLATMEVAKTSWQIGMSPQNTFHQNINSSQAIDLHSAVLSTDQSLRQAEASAEVLKAGLDAVGTIIDIQV